VGLIGLGWWWSREYTQPFPPKPFRAVDRASDIAKELYAPDLMHEWLPRGAKPIAPQTMPAQPSASPGIVVTDYRLAPGRLTCDVKTDVAGVVTLPHYLFPGWRATLDGKPAALSRDDNGLMTIEVSPDKQGRIEALFSATPAKRLGWFVSLASFVALVGLSIGVHRWRRC
jgi:hypothetical protein